jgi:D-arabinose 1-dehydrogenase-like Zn-dependent alcohol dehydrogenase
MKAMILEQPGSPLKAVELPDPEPGAQQIQVSITACGVCRTDLHVVDGDLTEPKLPIVPGHEIVGRVSALASPASPATRSTAAMPRKQWPTRASALRCKASVQTPNWRRCCAPG